MYLSTQSCCPADSHRSPCSAAQELPSPFLGVAPGQRCLLGITLRKMLPKHLSLLVNVQCPCNVKRLCKNSPFLLNKSAPCVSSSPVFFLYCQRRVPAPVRTAQLIRLGRRELPFCFAPNSSSQEPRAGFEGEGGLVGSEASGGVAERQKKPNKHPGLWLVTWKSDVEIKIPAMFFLQVESEHLQQNAKWLLQWYRVLGIKSVFLLSFHLPIYKILAVCATALHWLSNLY